MSIEAMYYEKLGDGNVRCVLCPHNCRIRPGKRGICRVRINKDGRLLSENYGQIASMALDPIEKKPLAMFRPGSYILSVGTFGCNFKCSFCQNWAISLAKPMTADISPDELVLKAEELKSRGNIGIAYTYNEPSIWYEFVLETAKKARDRGLLNVLVTNGFINTEPLSELLEYVDAMNIDVKAFTEDFYKKICGGGLEDVKKTVETAFGKCHVEVTTLIIPGLNDSIGEIEGISGWLASVSPDIPLHISRFYPSHEMRDFPPTPAKTIREAQKIAKKRLKYVFLGNV